MTSTFGSTWFHKHIRGDRVGRSSSSRHAGAAAAAAAAAATSTAATRLGRNPSGSELGGHNHGFAAASVQLAVASERPREVHTRGQAAPCAGFSDVMVAAPCAGFTDVMVAPEVGSEAPLLAKGNVLAAWTEGSKSMKTRRASSDSSPKSKRKGLLQGRLSRTSSIKKRQQQSHGFKQRQEERHDQRLDHGDAPVIIPGQVVVDGLVHKVRI